MFVAGFEFFSLSIFLSLLRITYLLKSLSSFDNVIFFYFSYKNALSTSDKHTTSNPSLILKMFSVMNQVTCFSKIDSFI